MSGADLERLLDLYGVTDQSLRGYAVDLCRRCRIGGWGPEMGPTASLAYSDFVAYESEAAEMYTCQVTLFPGLLQTRGYAAAVFQQHRPDDVNHLEQLEIREKRREVFDRPTPLILWTVVSESVFRHVIGGASVMVGQLEHLLDMSKDYPDAINIHVLPEDAPSHAALFGPFVIFSFPQRWEPDLVCLEEFVTSRFLQEPAEVRDYSILFRRLMNKDSLTDRESMKLIERYLKNYRKGWEK